jgi:uncharacterized protein
MRALFLLQRWPAQLRRLGRWLAVASVGLLLLLSQAQAQLAVPTLAAHVMDTTGTLNAVQVQQLEAKLTAFEQSRGTQMVLLLVPTTQPEDIASYGNRVANSWKIGRKEIGDGLLLVVAKDDRRVRIEVAKTLEGAIPDLAAKRVIDQAITPRFKQGDFAGGLDAGVDQLTALITGEALPAPVAAVRGVKNGFQWTDLAIFMFFAVPVVGAVARSIFGTKLGSLATGGLVGGIALLVTASLAIAALAALVGFVFALFSGLMPGGGRGVGRHGGWGAGSGGGGFGSGGGGDFGGGGASGRW